MSGAVRKASIVALKLCVLTAILAYAISQMQMDDFLALRAEKNAGADRPPTERTPNGELFYLLTATDGSRVRLPAAARLRVVGVIEGGGPDAAYHVQTADGKDVHIPASEVEGLDAVYSRLPGLRSTVRHVAWGPMLAALAVMALPPLLIGVRWLILLRAAGIRVPLWTGLRLHYLGLFFNTFMPGGTGGDIIKAIAVTRHTEHKAEAVSMILVDRVLGLVVVLLLPLMTLAFAPTAMAGVTRTISFGLLALMAGALLFFSRWFRALLRWETILRRLPGAHLWQRVDGAVYALRNRKRALLLVLALSFVLQLIAIFAIHIAGRALGVERATFRDYLIFVPVGFLANALPISFGGIGLMEGALLKLFSAAGVATAAQGFMIGVAVRLLMVVWALPGGLFALIGTGKRLAAEAVHTGGTDLESAAREPTTEDAPEWK